MSSKAAKTTTKKTVRKPGSPKAKAAPKRATVAILAENLKSLETRLKGADTKNRNALKALEGVVEEVKAAARQGTTTQKAALTRGLNTLEMRMETYLERAASDARASVRAEFDNVTAPGANLSTIEQAVQSAHERLDLMDTAQRDSLSRMNRHIADLAISVDRRLNGETQARKATSAALDAKIESVRETVETRIDQIGSRVDKVGTRVDQVEQETTDALQAIGAKITEFAAVLEDKTKSSDVDTAERLADLAQATQSEFNSIQTDMTTRLEALEMIASTWTPSDTTEPIAANSYFPANADDPRIDKMGETIQGLQDELSRMHARMASVQNNSSGAGSSVVAGNVVPLSALLNPAEDTSAEDNPYAAAARALEVSAADSTAPQMQTKRPPAAPITPPHNAHIPPEFDPVNPSSQQPPSQQPPKMTVTPSYMPTPISVPPLPGEGLPVESMAVESMAVEAMPVEAMPVQPAPVQAAPIEMPVAISAPPIVQPAASSSAFTASHTNRSNPLALPAGEPLMQAPLPVSTYDDPAYAEIDDMRAERIGGETSKRSSLRAPKVPVSGRNLRVGALALGVGVVGLFAAKVVLGGPDTGSTTVKNEVPAFSPAEGTIQNAALTNSNAIKEQADTSTPPQGKYAETRTPTVAAGAEDTLDAAVQAGNPIAQFQKGLVQLQIGQMEEGARLIRLAANRNQPAAQYRLAKLYESGTGIAKDPITARELIERAARGGNRIAMHDLGNYYADGQGGLDQDIAKALEWFEKAAERGVVDSQFNVAFLREGNAGIPADIETSLFWYHIASRQGDQGAPDRIAIISERLDNNTTASIKSRADRFNPKPVDEAANGIFRNAPWAQAAAKSNREKTAAQSAQILKIRDAQTLLSSLGYQVGTPDGISGSKTRNAVKSFEAVNGLPETGQVSDELIRKLEIATGA